MTESSAEATPSIADVAAEPVEESIEREREATGADVDTGDLVPPDEAQ